MSEILLDSREVASLAWRPFAGEEGLRDRVLWQDPDGRSYAGVLEMEPGSSMAPHLHRGAVHHLWVVRGECRISGRTFAAGSYVFVPRGVEHAIERAGLTGCTLFYLYLRVATASDDARPARNGQQAEASGSPVFDDLP
jgi:quercetin dioxygenase-like cupin family protein